MSSAIWRLRFLWTEWCNVLREAFPCTSWPALCRMWSGDQRPLCDGDVQEISPRAFCLHILPTAAQQRHIQGTEWEAVLSRVLQQTVRLGYLAVLHDWQHCYSICCTLFYFVFSVYVCLEYSVVVVGGARGAAAPPVHRGGTWSLTIQFLLLEWMYLICWPAPSEVTFPAFLV